WSVGIFSDYLKSVRTFSHFLLLLYHFFFEKHRNIFHIFFLIFLIFNFFLEHDNIFRLFLLFMIFLIFPIA
uniref:Uncharacterized protein n=1 Tax=Amphimedon queenslandica TaxID=400682 RepID=A0A1X7SDZ5_AMPQE